MSMSRSTRIATLCLLAIPGLAGAQSYPKATNGSVPNAEAPKAALTKLTVYPAKIELTGPRDEQRIGIVGDFADGRSWELARVAKYTSADPKIAEVDAAGIVRPIGDGQT